MAEEKPIIPPLRAVPSEFRTPSPSVVFFTELVSRTDAAYQQNAPVNRGTLYSTIVGGNQRVAETYPNLYFIAERKFGLQDQLVFWDWATVPDAEDTYNSEVKYVAESVNHPSFTRVYTLRRDDYDATPALPIGSTLTALIGVIITDGGQGYTYATGTITGTDVAINFVVAGGAIVSGVITDEGTGVLATDTIVISGDGLGAVVTPIVQPTNCYLTSQVKQEMIQASPFRDETQDNLRNEFVRVIRIYTTLPGPILTKTTIDANGDIMTETRQMVVASTLVTTNVIAAGVWTKTFEEPDDNLFTAFKIVQVRNTQNTLNSYEVEIPDLLPEQFRAQLPVTTTESIVIGTALLPTLVTGDLMRRQAQIDVYTYKLTVRGRGNITLPQTVTNTETTEQYGGGILDDTATLDLFSNLTIDQGFTVVSSEIKKLDDLPNGLAVKTTKQLIDGEWPILTEYDQDPETQSLITTTYQVVDAVSVVAPFIVNGVITRFKRIDKWRSLHIVETYSLPAAYDEQRFMAHTFPSLWNWHVYNYSTACGATGYIRQGFSTMVQARLHVYFTTTKQTITGLTLIPNTHHLVHDIINAVLNDVGTLNYVGTCSGPVFLPASSPTYSTYTTTIQNTEQLISGESVRWRAGLYKNSGLYVTML